MGKTRRGGEREKVAREKRRRAKWGRYCFCKECATFCYNVAFRIMSLCG
jgi:hypothetical protein